MAGLQPAESLTLGGSMRHDHYSSVCAQDVWRNWETEQDYGVCFENPPLNHIYPHMLKPLLESLRIVHIFLSA